MGSSGSILATSEKWSYVNSTRSGQIGYAGKLKSTPAPTSSTAETSHGYVPVQVGQSDSRSCQGRRRFTRSGAV